MPKQGDNIHKNGGHQNGLKRVFPTHRSGNSSRTLDENSAEAKPPSAQGSGSPSHPPGADRPRALHYRAALRALILLLLLVAALLGTSCVTTVTPPPAQANPTTVYIVNYGRHASLVLPHEDSAVEFEFGEWKWFALGHSQSPRIVPALFWRTQGTLGRRHLDYRPDRQRLQADRAAEDVLSIPVSAAAARQLHARLTARYEANRHTEIINHEYEMAFVKDPVPYSGWHNCNHELAEWLVQLDCEVRGGAYFARFKVLPAKRSP
jgi:hypothetical protein